MTAARFTLPTAWRCTHRDEPAPALVRFDDLSAALGELAAGDGGMNAVLAAAHIKVLSMLTDEPAFRAEMLWSPHGEGMREVHAEPHAAGTWRELVAHVRRASQTTRRAPELDAPEHDGEQPRGLDQAIFGIAATEEDYPRGYGLCVVALPGDRLLLRASGGVMDRDCLARLAEMYRRVLEAMSEAADGDALAAYLPGGERRAVLEQWSVGPRVERSPETVVELFEAQARLTPEATAVTSRGACMTYRELDERANRIAHRIAGLRAEQDTADQCTAVGVCLRRTLDLLPALLGVWKSGAPYLPLDIDSPPHRLRHMIASAGCRLVISHAEHLGVLGAPDSVGFVLLDEERETLAALPSSALGVPTSPAMPAYIMYTSGSTGVPKGVMIQHGGLANYLQWTARQYAARGRGGSPFFASIAFDLGVPSLFTPLITGQRVDLLPDPLDTCDLGALLAAGAPYSFIKMTPGHLNLLSLDLEPDQARGLAGLVIAAGDAFPAELARRWIGLAGHDGTPVATEYGPTEITVGNSGKLIDDPGDGGLIALGAAIPNTTMYVLSELLEPVPVGVPGEIYVGGAGVSAGYLGDCAQTAERFVPDPYGPPGSRLYRTGDRGRWRAGELDFLGRTDHQVKIRGYRVETAEVQAALRRHADVSKAVVIACERPAGPASLAAFVIPAADRPLQPASLRAALADELPEYMVPSHIVAVDDFPLTANGKVDTRALQALVRGAPA